MVKIFIHFYCVKSMVLCSSRAVQIVYSLHHRNSIVKALHVPTSLWRPCHSGSSMYKQPVLCKPCVPVMRLPVMSALASQTAILLGRRTMRTYTSEWILPGPLCAGFTALVSLSQTLETQALIPHLHNILWGCGSADIRKTM